MFPPLRGSFPLPPLRWPTTFECVGFNIRIFTRVGLKTETGVGGSWPKEDIASTWKEAEKLLDKGKIEAALDRF